MGYTGDKKRQYQREWVAKRRASWFADKVCVDCGSIQKLELDHIDPSTKISHSIWSWSWKRINEEVAKCAVRCTGCHLIKTALNGDNGFNYMYKHGTGSMYNIHGCRCEDCKLFKRNTRTKTMRVEGRSSC